MFYFERYPQFTSVLLKNGERFLLNLKRRMPKSDCFGRSGQPETDLAQLSEDLGLGYLLILGTFHNSFTFP